MTDHLSIALAQINPAAGNLAANADRLRAVRAEAAARGADLVVCPAAGLSGAPLLDLAALPAFLDTVEATVQALAEDTADGGPALLVGAPWHGDSVPGDLGRDGSKRHNAALLLDGGRIAAIRFQAVMDSGEIGGPEEDRFDSGPMPGPVNVRGVRIGLLVGGDLTTGDVAETLAESGAELLVAMLASPFAPGRADQRIHAGVARVVECGLPLAAVNLIGGQDERVFDGGSFALAPGGRLVAQAPLFAEHLLLTRWERGDDDGWDSSEAETIAPAEGTEALYGALVLGLHDAVTKSGAPGVAVGLTGGLDSALVAAIAVDALGPERVLAVRAPLPGGPDADLAGALADSLDDAAEIVELLGCRLDNVALAPLLKAADSLLAPAFAGRDPAMAVERMHARLRAATLAALAERMGALLLSSVDRTDRLLGLAPEETGCGYAVLADVPKTAVLELARWRNRNQPAASRGPAGLVVPERVLTRRMKAETPAGLPPAEALDDLLAGLLDGGLSPADLMTRGHASETVAAVWRLMARAEAGRRGAPPGPRVSRRSTVRLRRFPIAGDFTDLL
ncbi:NAD(+) synthase [Azospirillum melinis]|uniref:Glutamine-dependent NAD(+) synthetase n=1 Tax=Azospirillum melinis TaxID=328839 RepID=A0ABX2KG25_9PROT|nr:NAD(+) synthase [Azospirillum melinis]MBP2305102.1 NAD+ synthase [Azospirillum melinis]NUB02555.1 NAD(+) synthase [Azospirillum melinis]